MFCLSNINESTSLEARPAFPFTSIVGQRYMKLALLLNLIDSKIGGVMIMGDRGTGKSTTIRAIGNLLPGIQAIKNDPFNSSPTDFDLMSDEVKTAKLKNEVLETHTLPVPLVDLPLGATEDRVCGTIDMDKALTDGCKVFEPGLLAKANRGLLYVDEVNLLDDHLIDILLDSAASGWNTVEREGISIKHPARFVLIGSGNPEEGELRPQLLDRFGMHAEIKTVRTPIDRVCVVKQRSRFDADTTDSLKLYTTKENFLRHQVKRAQDLLPDSELPKSLRLQISTVCGKLNVDGFRGDIVTNRAARAHATFCGRRVVLAQDIKLVITLCLSHRLRTDPLESIDSGSKVSNTYEHIAMEAL